MAELLVVPVDTTRLPYQPNDWPVLTWPLSNQISAFLDGSGDMEAADLSRRHPNAVFLSGSGSVTASDSGAPRTCTMTGSGTAAALLEATSAVQAAAGGTSTMQARLHGFLDCEGSGFSSLDAVVTSVHLREADLPGFGDVSAFMAGITPGESSLAGSGDLAALPVDTRQVEASLPGEGSLAAHPVVPEQCAGTADGSSSLAAIPAETTPVSGEVSGSSSLSAAPVQTESAAADVAGFGALVAAPVRTEQAAFGAGGYGQVEAGIGFIQNRAAALAGSSGVASEVTPVFRVAAALAGTGGVQAAGFVAVRRGAYIPAVGVLQVTAQAALSRSASLSGSGSLSAVVNGTSDAVLTGVGTVVAWVISDVPVASSLPGAGLVEADVIAAAFIASDQLAGHGFVSAFESLSAREQDLKLRIYDAVLHDPRHWWDDHTWATPFRNSPVDGNLYYSDGSPFLFFYGPPEPWPAWAHGKYSPSGRYGEDEVPLRWSDANGEPTYIERG